jgi:hypothetical protein
MDISIVLPTYRPGGLDMIVPALKNQTFKGSWELLLADELYDKRHDAVVNYTIKEQIRLEHIKADNLPYLLKQPIPQSSKLTEN